MKRYLLLITTLLLTTSCIDNKEPTHLGVGVRKLGKVSGFALAPCQKSNCVNSQPELTDEKRLIDPIKIISTKDLAFEKIMGIVLKDQSLNIISSTDTYIKAKQVQFGKIITDVEFFFAKSGQIHMRAEMRGVPHDLGNGRRLVESIRFKFHQNDY
ncbi:hypothetical protein A9Q84_18795 [Halobacteriovorax marinus]|uniref:Lipoprotein n=1 Tax=Halobacteriovorax marinus TaxID=97084 RepID=A0A1Y5F2I0_9BACT|nr:hypothetical protein A9Q84_18795 [Halobacteriovorax marinus]